MNEFAGLYSTIEDMFVYDIDCKIYRGAGAPEFDRARILSYSRAGDEMLAFADRHGNKDQKYSVPYHFLPQPPYVILQTHWNDSDICYNQLITYKLRDQAIPPSLRMKKYRKYLGTCKWGMVPQPALALAGSFDSREIPDIECYQPEFLR